MIARNVVSRNRGDLKSAYQKVESGSVPAREVQPEEVRERRRRRKGRRQKTLRERFLMLIIWLGCLALVLLTVRAVKRAFKRFGQTDSGFVTLMSPEEKAFYFQERATVFNVLASYLQARTVERKSNYVAGSTRVVGMMGPYYERNEMRLPAGALDGEPVFWNLEVEAAPPYLEGVWRDATGQSFEAVFVRDESGWKIDWPHFRRLSDEDWIYFRQRFSKITESNFRLWVEIQDQRSGEETEMISFRFLPPDTNASIREREASPYLKVARLSPEGEFLMKLLSSSEEQEEKKFVLSKRDPSDLHRVQVTLAWSVDPLTEENVLLVKEFHADHWRSLPNH